MPAKDPIIRDIHHMNEEVGRVCSEKTQAIALLLSHILLLLYQKRPGILTEMIKLTLPLGVTAISEDPSDNTLIN